MLSYTGDKSASYPFQHMIPVIEVGIKQSALRDEIYCQIMKQLTDNPNPASTEKYW